MSLFKKKLIMKRNLNVFTILEFYLAEILFFSIYLCFILPLPKCNRNRQIREWKENY